MLTQKQYLAEIASLNNKFRHPLSPFSSHETLNIAQKKPLKIRKV
jgi:hypothetical protein